MRLRRRTSLLVRAAACRLRRNILRPYLKVLNIALQMMTATRCCWIIRTIRGRRSFAGGRCRRCSSAGITRKWLNGGGRRHSRRRGGTGRICFCEDNLPRYTVASVNCERQSGLLLRGLRLSMPLRVFVYLGERHGTSCGLAQVSASKDSRAAPNERPFDFTHKAEGLMSETMRTNGK